MIYQQPPSQQQQYIGSSAPYDGPTSQKRPRDPTSEFAPPAFPPFPPFPPALPTQPEAENGQRRSLINRDHRYGVASDAVGDEVGAGPGARTPGLGLNVERGGDPRLMSDAEGADAKRRKLLDRAQEEKAAHLASVSLCSDPPSRFERSSDFAAVPFPLRSNSLHPTFYHLPTYPKPTSCLPSTFHLQTLYANHPRTETITSPVLLRLPLALAEVLFSPESFLWRSTKPSTIIDDHLPTTRIRRSDPTTGGLDPAPSSPRANDVPTPTIARSGSSSFLPLLVFETSTD